MSIITAIVDVAMSSRMAECEQPPIILFECGNPSDRERLRRRIEDELQLSVYSSSDPGGHGDRYRFAIAGLDVRLTLPDQFDYPARG